MWEVPTEIFSVPTAVWENPHPMTPLVRLKKRFEKWLESDGRKESNLTKKGNIKAPKEPLIIKWIWMSSMN